MLRRRRQYDRRILEWIASHDYVTAHQVLHRFFCAHGKSASYGERVVLRLMREGYLQAERRDPDLGRASRTVLSLTRDGWHRILRTPYAAWGRKVSYDVREYRIQFAEMLMMREAQHWRLATVPQTPLIVRDWLLRRYRNRMLNGSEHFIRDRLERMSIDRLGLRVLVHDPTGDVRFIVPVRRGRSIRHCLAALPANGLWPSVEFELVCSDVGKLEHAERVIRRWAARARVKHHAHCVAHHMTRKHPRATRRRSNGPMP